ncbi:MAG: nicotinate phosphoribosyltransferase [Candidatus Magnetoovum sp. WYHC-5]|nr:nicotinate phosphoribosyltransferase [Candidatus Magnetoovum sp. WYHC-5]
MFHTAKPEEILKGVITDVYFERTMKVLKAKGINPLVKAEFIAKSLPDDYKWAVMAGLEEVLYLVKDLPIKIRSLREGTIFYPYEPVLEIEGRYQDFCVFETAILGLICQASGIATKAARFKKLADGRLVASFGARRMHPVLAPMIERNAYIGGCDGVAVVKSGQIIEEEPMGTMPHALILCFGSTVEALKAYNEVIEPTVKRVALIDTFIDEKFEALNVVQMPEVNLYAIRFDTPSSRRGNFYRIIEEVRWELNLRGYGHIKIFVSGGITEADMQTLNLVVDAYGIGTAISNAPVIDYSMDIVEIDGKPAAKRGKWSGSKKLNYCAKCKKRKIIPYSEKPEACDCGNLYEDILIPVINNKERLIPIEKPAQIRQRLLTALLTDITL